MQWVVRWLMRGPMHWGLAVDDSTYLAFRRFWCSNAPKFQIVSYSFVYRCVRQTLCLQFSMATPHKGFQRLVEVGKYLGDDPNRLIPAQCRGSDEVIQKIVDWASSRHRGLILSV